MILIGLTGRSGSGKGVICHLFAELYDIPSIDCDKLSRTVCSPGAPCTQELSKVFGAEILDGDGVLQRRALADIVFGDAEKTALLNHVTHKYILAACETEIARFAERNVPALILDAPTLFESGLSARCDVILSVVARDEDCISRICARDGLSLEQAKKRLKSQPDQDFYLAKSNYIVYNSTSDMPEAQIREIAEAILRSE